MRSIFIYGGCVTRDAFTLLEQDFELGEYVARQSLISGMSPPADLPAPSLKSSFRRRMVANDFSSSLLPMMHRMAGRTDLFVMDTNIERLGVFDLGGRYITRSVEFMESGVLPQISPTPRWVPPRDPRYLPLYEQAASGFSKQLEAVGLLSKAIVVDAPMATVDSAGEPLVQYLGRPVRETSKLLRQMTAILAAVGFRVVEVPREFIVADVDHQWGSVPLALYSGGYIVGGSGYSRCGACGWRLDVGG